MKLVYWNLRGIGNVSTQEALQTMCNKFRPSFICLAEPMVEFDKVPVALWRFLRFELIVTNDKGRDMPSLWLLASIDIKGWNIIVVAATIQHVTVAFNYQGICCFFTGV